MTKLTIQTEDENVRKYENLYQSRTEGEERAIQGFLFLRKSTLASLRDHFTRTEMMSLVYSYKIKNIPPNEQSKIRLKWVVLDGEEFGGEMSKRNVSVQGMVEKIGKLSLIQAYFLQEELFRFWNVEEAYGQEEPDIEKILHLFCTKKTEKMTA